MRKVKKKSLVGWIFQKWYLRFDNYQSIAVTIDHSWIFKNKSRLNDKEFVKVRITIEEV